MSLQGLFSYPGIRHFKMARYTQSHGVLPDAITVDIVPQPIGEIAEVGTATFAFGNTLVQLRNCVVDFATLRPTKEGYVQRVRLLDGRWLWRFGDITGLYNLRDGEQNLNEALERTPQQLAEILLRAMGVTYYDVSGLPNSSRPYVSWECANPANELRKLCDSLGCRVVLGYNNDPVRIVQLGLGTPLPNDSDVTSVTYGVNGAEAPDSIKLCSARALFQSKLKLQAVGRDGDGSIKKLDDLSYKPTDGWGDPVNFSDVSEASAQLAKDTVFRLYRVVSQADGTMQVPGYDGVVGTVAQLLPLRTSMIGTYEDVDGFQRPKAAEVRGVFRPYRTPDAVANTDFDTKCEVPFRVLPKEGFVYFERPVYQVDSAGALSEAELYLETSYHVRDYYSGQPVRYEKSRQVRSPALGTGPLVVTRDDLVYTSIASYGILSETNYVPQTVQTNLGTLVSDMDSVLAGMAAQYSVSESFSVAYRGIKPFRLDGVTHQLTWVVQDTFPGAATYAALNSETDPYVLPYSSRRRLVAERALGQSLGDREALEDYSR